MVKKLFKHELEYYLRSLLPVYMVLGGIALIGRIIEFFEADTTAYSILRGSSVTMLVIACVAALGMTILFSVIRFYKNLFTGEGYLTLTLPVTIPQHILVKLAAALVANVATLVAIVLAICLFTVGPWLVEIIKAVAYIYKDIAANFEGNFGWYVVECIPLLLMLICAYTMLYYMCICIGQQAKKNRVIAAVGAYFGLYVITQIISTVVVIIVSISEVIWLIDDFLMSLTQQEVFGLIHGGIWVLFVIAGGLAAIYYVVCKHIMSKRLNLE